MISIAIGEYKYLHLIPNYTEVYDRAKTNTTCGCLYLRIRKKIIQKSNKMSYSEQLLIVGLNSVNQSIYTFKPKNIGNGYIISYLTWYPGEMMACHGQ